MSKQHILFVPGTGVKSEQHYAKVISHLTQKGYVVEYIGSQYQTPHTLRDLAPRRSIPILQKALQTRLTELDKTDTSVIVMGHSFGGLLVNSVLAKKKFRCVKKVITLATFHHLELAPFRLIKHLFHSAKWDKNDARTRLSQRHALRDKFGYADISNNYLCYTVGFKLDLLVGTNAAKMKNSQHLTVFADHGFLFRVSRRIQNRIFDFTKI